MTSYQYVKAPQAKVIPRERRVRAHQPWRRIFSFTAILLGVVLFGSAAGPILSYEIFTAPQFRAVDLADPAGRQSPQVFGSTSGSGGSADLTNVNNWFPNAPQPQIVSTKINTYTLTIPKLRITDATVKIGGEDLSDSLIQYAGTALPGQPGNAVVIGHSVLPQFFNQTSYLTIFSTLPTLRPGDDFFIFYDGIQYRYVVEDMVEVEPTDFTVLEQRFDDAFATLITCVPPGLKTKRLAVRARLVNNLKPI